MSFTYKIVTEEEANQSRFKLIEPGDYNFEVVDSKFTYSKAGNEMTVLDLKVWDNEGKTHIIKDFLVNIDSMQFKTKHFCYAVGLKGAYDSGKFDETLCTGRKGKAKVFISKEKEKDGVKYGPKNVIEDYIVTDVEANKPIKEFISDDLPF